MHKKVNDEKAVVIFSGGQDSTTCLFWAKRKYQEVYAVSFDYDQKHKLELQCAIKICDKAGIQHYVLNLSLLNDLTTNSLTRSDIMVENSTSNNEMPNTFVSGRNLLFLVLTGIFAKEKSINHIILGVSESDFSGYPDCRDVFIKSANVTLDLALDFPFELHTPLMWLNKQETWSMAHQLGVLGIIKNDTLTCYNGIIGDGCSHCPACKLRSKGYRDFIKETKENKNTTIER